MTVRAVLERRVDMLGEAIEEMEQTNDGSLRWVDELREMINDLQDAEEALSELGGYREANSRF